MNEQGNGNKVGGDINWVAGHLQANVQILLGQVIAGQLGIHNTPWFETAASLTAG